MTLPLVLLLLCPVALGFVAPPHRLRVEQLLEHDARGIDSTRPSFSWQLAPRHNTPISAVNVLLSRSREQVETAMNGSETTQPNRVYNMTVIIPQHAAQSLAVQPVRYLGPPLLSSRRYYWTVCIDTNGTTSCARTHSFVTGVLPGISWQGQWITGNSSSWPNPCTRCMASYHAWCTHKETGPPCGFAGVQLRSPDLLLPSTIAEAVVHVTAVGMSELRMNGQKIGDAVLDPGFSTNFTERLLYSTYDVTEMLQNSTTAVLAARIGAGKYSLGEPSVGWGFLFEMHLRLVDKTQLVIGTNSSWRVSHSPIVSENLYHGEVYDARREQTGWELPLFDTTEWAAASTEYGSPVTGVLSAMLMPQIKEMETLQTQLVSQSQTWVLLDAGVNLAGYARLALQSGVPSGTRVVMSFGEVLDHAGSLANPFGQRDTYVYSGKENNGSTWQPSFIYHGFRYINVSGLLTSQIRELKLEAVFVHSAVESISSVVFPEPRSPQAKVLDKIHKAVLQTQLSNLHSIPTDCPQREKRGWMGDAQWTAEEASINFDTHALYANWVRTMGDMQTKGCTPTQEQFTQEPPYGTCCSPTTDQLHPTIFQCSPMSNVSDTAGSVPDVVPLLWGNGGGRGWPGAPVWGSALTVIPDVVRARFGGIELLEACKQNLDDYMDFLNRQSAFAPGKVLPQFGLLGDWLSLDPICPGGNDECLSNPGWIQGNPTTAFQYILNLQSMIHISQSVGDQRRLAAYSTMLKRALPSYHAVFFNHTLKSYGKQQTANVLPIYAGVVPEEDLPSVAAALVQSIADFPSPGNGPHVSTGGVGSRWILQALTIINRTDLALELASQTSPPSWGHFAFTAPGTFWENWDGQKTNFDGSYNHIMLAGGVDPWIFHHVSGIRLPSTRCAAGFGRGGLSIGPFELDLGVEGVVAQAVGSCNTTVTVQGGQVTMAWEYQESENSSSMVYSIYVPFPYKARLWYSGMVNSSLGPRYATKVWHSGKLLHAHEAGSQASFAISLPTGVTRTRIAYTPLAKRFK